MPAVAREGATTSIDIELVPNRTIRGRFVDLEDGSPRADLWAVVRGATAPVPDPEDSKDADLTHDIPELGGGGNASPGTGAGEPAPAEAGTPVGLTSAPPKSATK